MTTNDKIDLYKQHKDQYVTPKKPVLVTMDEAMYLTVTGRGAPGGPEFTDRIGALYGAAFTIKMTRKFAGQQDYVVSKLEAQWWLDGESCDFANTPKEPVELAADDPNAVLRQAEGARRRRTEAHRKGQGPRRPTR